MKHPNLFSLGLTFLAVSTPSSASPVLGPEFRLGAPGSTDGGASAAQTTPAAYATSQAFLATWVENGTILGVRFQQNGTPIDSAPVDGMTLASP